MVILGIETSCDETGVAILKDSLLAANVIASQEDIHAVYGGIVPELASRAHCSRIDRLWQLALQKSRLKPESIQAIGVTSEPGLKGSLLVGVCFAAALAYALNVPLYTVNHLHAHLAASFLHPQLSFPCLGLVVSGGHTSFFFLPDKIHLRLIGQTLDDACGETFDKVARMLNLTYPGGPEIEKLAKTGDPFRYHFPRALLSSNSLNFSFSGLKTALLYHIKKYGQKDLPDICASFQKTVGDILVEKIRRALVRFPVKSFLFGGGVIRNRYLAGRITRFLKKEGVKPFVPPASLCLDNGAMVAILTAALIESGVKSSSDKITVVPTKQ